MQHDEPAADELTLWEQRGDTHEIKFDSIDSAVIRKTICGRQIRRDHHRNHPVRLDLHHVHPGRLESRAIVTDCCGVLSSQSIYYPHSEI